MRGQRLFRVIGRVLDPGEGIAFARLPGTSQFLDAFVAGFLNIRQPSEPPDRPGAIGPNLGRIVAQFLEPGVFIAFEFGIPFWKSLLREFSFPEAAVSLCAVSMPLREVLAAGCCRLIGRFVIAGGAAGFAVHEAVGADADVAAGLAEAAEFLTVALAFRSFALEAAEFGGAGCSGHRFKIRQSLATGTCPR